MITFIRAIFYGNGGKIKHLPNRAVCVHKIHHPESPDPSVLIEFSRADSGNDMSKSPVATTKRGSAEITGIVISREAALALTVLLQDYWSRIDPDFINLPAPPTGAQTTEG